MMNSKIFFGIFLFLKVVFAGNAFVNQNKESNLNKVQQPYFIMTNERLRFKVSYLGLVGGYADMHTESFPEKKNVCITLKAKTVQWVEKIYKLDMTLTSISKKSTLSTLFL